jgi:2-keto-3-deoxy-L-rhamnonate aldolase RhmA
MKDHMIAHIDKLRAKLNSGQLCLGAGITFTDPAVTEALADSVDFLWIDLEHTPIDLDGLLSHLIAARAGGAPALVRVPAADPIWAKRVLDIGAEAIIAPQVRTAEEARAFVSACRYPPMGTRGYGPRRPSNYGRNGGIDYLEDANRRIFVVIQIETASAVDEFDEILKIEGFDSIVIGPNDLAGSMGLPGRPRDPKVLATMQTVIDAARAAGKYVGVGMGDEADHALEAHGMGIQWIQCGNDFSYMNRFADRLYAEVRKEL